MNHPPQQSPRVTIKLMPDPNPWDDAAALPRMRLPSLLLLSFVVIACAVFPAAPAPAPLYTLAMLVVCAGAQIIFVRSIGAAVLSAAVFLCGTLGGSLVGGTTLLCLLTALAFGSFLITVARSPWLMFIPVTAYAVSFLLCGDILTAALSLITLPAAGMLAYTTMKNSGRVGVICATSFMFGLLCLFAFAIGYYRQSGALSFSGIMQTLAQVREELIVTLQQDEYMERLRQMLAEQSSSEQPDMTALVRTAVELVFNLLPAIAVLLCNLIALAAQTLCNRTYIGSGMPAYVTQSSQLFIMSIPSAVLFFICAPVSLFTLGSTMATAVMLNIAVILLPPMCIVGFFKTVADLHRHASPFTVLLLVAGIICAPGALILCLAISGALTTIVRPIIAHMLLKNNRDA